MNKFGKVLLLAIVIIFLVMFFTSSSGYYEYELNKKATLTQEAIDEFEKDIEEGKEIDINDYLVEDKKDYSNTFSNIGLEISNKIGEIFKEGVKLIFNSVGNLVDD